MSRPGEPLKYDREYWDACVVCGLRHNPALSCPPPPTPEALPVRFKRILSPEAPGNRRYLLDFEAGIINAARALARRSGKSLNRLVRELLLEYLTAAERLADPLMHEIELGVGVAGLVALTPPRPRRNQTEALLQDIVLDALPQDLEMAGSFRPIAPDGPDALAPLGLARSAKKVQRTA